MKHVLILLIGLAGPTLAVAQELGHYHIDIPTPVPAPAEAFKSRGLTSTEVMSLHSQRIACARRLYARDGHSLEGDADLKVTQITQDLMEVEFPAHYQIGTSEINTVVLRQLLNVRRWVDGKSLKLTTSVTVNFLDKKEAAQTVPATVEVRVIDGAYPPTFLLKETVMTEKKIEVYFICQ